jgi:S-adenosylmethionine decarboxylase
MFVGKHMLLHVKDVPTSLILERMEAGKPLLDEIVKVCDLHVVNEVGHQFAPSGYTYLFLLSESHMSIHTYPEYGSCYMDIFCCNPTFQHLLALETVKRLFQTEHVDWDLLQR